MLYVKGTRQGRSLFHKRKRGRTAQGKVREQTDSKTGIQRSLDLLIHGGGRRREASKGLYRVCAEQNAKLRGNQELEKV